MLFAILAIDVPLALSELYACRLLRLMLLQEELVDVF